MCRIVWITLLLLSTSGVYANEQLDGAEGSVHVIEGYGSREQLDLKQKNQTNGLSFAVIGFDGGNPNCDFVAGTGVVQSVIDAGYEEIRLVRGTHNDNIEITDQSINIKGKYATCVAAQLDIPSEQPSHISILSGLAGAALPTVQISGNSQRNSVLFKNLHISNGEPAVSLLTGGGIDVRSADVALTLDTVQVIGNEGTLGGGVSVFGNATDVSMIDSLVSSNSAQEGGGIYCFGDGVTINMRDRGPQNPSGVAFNQATNGNGGGLYIWGGCEYDSTSGSYGQDGFDLNGIVGNSATGEGGGIYVSSGSDVILDGSQTCGSIFCIGNNDSNVRVSANSADGDGGGIYVTGDGTKMTLINAVIADNSAGVFGGGMAADQQAEIFISSYDADECWSPGSCSQITANESTTGGGVSIRNGGVASLYLTVISQNRANTGVAVSVNSGSGDVPISIVELVGSLVVNNGSSGGDFADNIAILLSTGGQAFINNSTVADNDVALEVILAGPEALLDVRSSIIHQSNGLPVYVQTGSPLQINANCLMLSSLDEFNNVPGLGLVTVDDPAFVNRGAGDYHLSDQSPAIDYCSRNLDTFQQPFDLDRDNRGWDDPAVPNSKGNTYDLGYDENIRFISDLIFRNGFEQES